MDKLTKERNAAIAAVIRKNPGLSKRRTAMVLFAEHPQLFSSVESARSAIRARTGADGYRSKQMSAESKSAAKAYKPPKKPVYAMPKSKAKPWEPFVVDGKCSIGVLSDIHFPKHHEKALKNSVDFLKGKIDVLVLNGDIADAEEFGSWAKSPKAVQTEDSVQCVRDGLLWILSQFPKARVIYKFGNHEERLDRYCWGKAPELVGLPHITWEGLLTIGQDLKPIDELSRIEWVKDQRPIMAGKLPIFHGHELPKSLISSVNPARGAFLRLIDTVLVGHFHRSSSHVEYNWQRDAINCWSTGCLCDLSPQYAVINKWNWGFAMVDVSANGDFDVQNFKLLKNGKVVGA